MPQPRLGSSPVAEGGGGRNLKQLGGLGNVEASEEAALDQHRLAWLHPFEFPHGVLQCQQVFFARGRLERSIEGDDDGSGAPSAFGSVSAPGRLDQHLAHGADGDPFEVESGGDGQMRRVGQLQPSLVD